MDEPQPKRIKLEEGAALPAAPSLESLEDMTVGKVRLVIQSLDTLQEAYQVRGPASPSPRLPPRAQHCAADGPARFVPAGDAAEAASSARAPAGGAAAAAGAAQDVPGGGEKQRGGRRNTAG
jgi:hypothetical protein